MIGFLNIYKPKDITSNDVVQKIRKKFKLKKIGHMGTLDPMACGILPIAIGKATRLFDYMQEKRKTYIVEYIFGYETDTLDITGVETNRNNVLPSLEIIKEKISKMIGKQSQMPPKYSAKNVNGRRAYNLAREGVDFELNPKEIEIFNIEIINFSDNSIRLKIECSSGTYIRAIGRDLAYSFGGYATMSYLERCQTSLFSIENSITLDEVLDYDSLDNIIISPLDVFVNYDRITIDLDTYQDLRNGKFVKHDYIKNNSFVLFGDKIIGVCKGNKSQLKLDTYLEEEI